MGFRYSLGLLGLLSLAVLGGCFDRQTATAGQIGCPASELEISDDDLSVGSTDTWTATCRDHTFICSHITRGSSGIGVSCHEEIAKATAEAPRNDAANRGPATPKSAGPAAAAGFSFDQSPADAQKICEDAGKIWKAESDTVGTCSGSAQALGFVADVSIRFCDAKACRITVHNRPEDKWTAAVAQIKSALTEKYGAPQETDAALPNECSAEPKFVACLDDKGLILRYTWRWPSQQKLEMIVGKPKGASESGILLVYARQQPKTRAVNDSAL
ncbi:MAG TPA: hypothetical protein VGI10_02930 [Polyangiaceae bacterium]|jgi:hypothetical protein